MTADPLLSVRSLSVDFSSYGRRSQVLRDVSLDVPAHRHVALVGESGCGKSVTMRAIMGILSTPPARIASGAILFDRRDLLRLRPRERKRTAWGRCGSLLLHRIGLAPITPCRSPGAQSPPLHQEVGGNDRSFPGRGYPSRVPRVSASGRSLRCMPKHNDLSRCLVTLEQASTLIAVVEMGQSSWLVAGIAPGLDRYPLKKLGPDRDALLQLLHRWRNEAAKVGHAINRIAVAYEAGRDGFWLARWLRSQSIEAYVIHPSSVPVSREHRRAKTDRLDTELLKRAFLGWLRGEPKHCSMAAIPTLEDEDARRPGRERQILVGERTGRLSSLICGATLADEATP